MKILNNTFNCTYVFPGMWEKKRADTNGNTIYMGVKLPKRVENNPNLQFHIRHQFHLKQYGG
jgi:hypothetical protein